MGLAATQARFLNLTARKTNLEYEGQQINQQRTSLANKSANYYSQMLTLSVPVPPSEANFTKVVYTFPSTSNADETNTINQVTGNDSSANIIYTRTYTNNYNMNRNERLRSISLNGQTYECGNKELKTLDQCHQDLPNVFTDDIVYSIGNGLMAAGLTFQNDYKQEVYVLNVGSDNNPSYEYYTLNDLQNSNPQDGVQGYTAGSVTAYEQRSLSNVRITRDANSRIAAIRLDGTNVDLAVTASTIKDSVAYNDAYAEYEYQTYLYQQKMEEINAQTSVIQAQDKKLELRLKQLDTEQNAVSTEMQNISSLIDKNVEDTFKVFA